MFDIKPIYQDPLTIAVATAAVGTAASVHQSAQARSEQRKAARVERRIQDVKAARERRRAIREARIARADVEAGAQATGAGTSSGAITGSGTIGTQLASNLSFLDQASELQTQSSIFRQKAANFSGRAQDFGAVSNIALTTGSLFGRSGGGSNSGSGGSGGSGG